MEWTNICNLLACDIPVKEQPTNVDEVEGTKKVAADTDSSLIFVPRFLTLPPTIQCNLLYSIIQHKDIIPHAVLQRFCNILNKAIDKTNLTSWTMRLFSELLSDDENEIVVDDKNIDNGRESPLENVERENKTLGNNEHGVHQFSKPSSIYKYLCNNKNVLPEILYLIKNKTDGRSKNDENKACTERKEIEFQKVVKEETRSEIEITKGIENDSSKVIDNNTDDVIIIDDEMKKMGENTTLDRISLVKKSRNKDDFDGVRQQRKRRKIEEPAEKECPIAVPDSPPQSQPFNDSQVSQVVTDCPLANYEGSLLTATDLGKLGALKDAWRDGKHCEDMTDELGVFLQLTSEQMEEACSGLQISSLSKSTNALSTARSHIQSLSPGISHSKSQMYRCTVYVIICHQMEEACFTLQIPILSNNALSTACSHIQSLQSGISHGNVCILTRAAFTEKIMHLSQPIPRSLLTTLLSHASIFPLAVTDMVITPCFEASSGINTHQAECVSYLINDQFSPPSNLHLFEKILTAQPVITEGLLNVLTAIFEKQPPLTETMITKFLSMIDKESVTMAKDLKFTKLLMLFIKSYSLKLQPNHKTTLAMIAAHNKTFLKKSLQTTVAKINN